MAQYDVHQSADTLLLDCQSDLLNNFNTRFVVPLLPPDLAPLPAGRLNPAFQIEGETYIMVTQFASAIEPHRLGAVLASLAGQDRQIMNALDVLLTGV